MGQKAGPVQGLRVTSYLNKYSQFLDVDELHRLHHKTHL